MTGEKIDLVNASDSVTHGAARRLFMFGRLVDVYTHTHTQRTRTTHTHITSWRGDNPKSTRLVPCPAEILKHQGLCIFTLRTLDAQSF